MGKIDESVYIASGAQVIGDVTIGKDCGIWYNAVIRGDSNAIRIGERSNIQDLCILHTDREYVLSVGNDVTVGHGAILHGCTVGNNVLIGMGAIVMNGAKIGNDCVIGAGALVTEHTVIPDGMMAFGSPAKIKRALNEQEIQGISASAEHYARYAAEAKTRSKG